MNKCSGCGALTHRALCWRCQHAANDAEQALGSESARVISEIAAELEGLIGTKDHHKVRQLLKKTLESLRDKEALAEFHVLPGRDGDPILIRLRVPSAISFEILDVRI